MCEDGHPQTSLKTFDFCFYFTHQTAQAARIPAKRVCGSVAGVIRRLPKAKFIPLQTKPRQTHAHAKKNY